MHHQLQNYINNIIDKGNYNHFLVHGPKGSGKKTLFKNALNIKNLYNFNYEKLQYKKYSNNYFFDSYYINKYKQHFIKFIKEICNSNINEFIKHIFITNCEFIQRQIYDFLRKFLETGYDTNCFIFICSSSQGAIETIKSHCLFIRVPYPSNEEYYTFINQQCKISGIPFKKSFMNEKNIQKLLDIILLENIGAEYIDNIQLFCENVLDNIKDYKKIQELVQNIVKNGYNSREVMKFFGNYMCDIRIYKLVTEYDHKLALGYRELLHMEALFYQIHLLLK